MFKPSEAAGRAWSVAAVLALSLPPCVLAGVTTTSQTSAKPVAPVERAAKAAAS